MNIEQLFLVRSGELHTVGDDPSLSPLGEKQSETLGKHLRRRIKDFHPIIWAHPSAATMATARIIRQLLPYAEIVIIDRSHDFQWFKEQLEAYKGKTLIVVDGAKFVQEFPAMLGFEKNDASFAQGILVERKKCKPFS